jgi:hypothetical protein
MNQTTELFLLQAERLVPLARLPGPRCLGNLRELWPAGGLCSPLSRPVAAGVDDLHRPPNRRRRHYSTLPDTVHSRIAPSRE